MEKNNIEKNPITPNQINQLNNYDVFVFGSNLSGIHGAGAAKKAMEFGAVWGKGDGWYGKTYAIPTKSLNIERTLRIDEIKPYVDVFIKRAKESIDYTFFVTEIGCGLAGYKPKDIAPLFKDAIGIKNISLPKSFINLIK